MNTLNEIKGFYASSKMSGCFFRLCRIQGEQTVTHRPSARYEMPCFSGICSLTITHKRQDEKGSVASEQYSKGASAG